MGPGSPSVKFPVSVHSVTLSLSGHLLRRSGARILCPQGTGSRTCTSTSSWSCRCHEVVFRLPMAKSARYVEAEQSDLSTDGAIDQPMALSNDGHGSLAHQGALCRALAGMPLFVDSAPDPIAFKTNMRIQFCGMLLINIFGVVHHPNVSGPAVWGGFALGLWYLHSHMDAAQAQYIFANLYLSGAMLAMASATLYLFGCLPAPPLYMHLYLDSIERMDNFLAPWALAIGLNMASFGIGPARLLSFAPVWLGFFVLGSTMRGGGVLGEAAVTAIICATTGMVVMVLVDSRTRDRLAHQETLSRRIEQLSAEKDRMYYDLALAQYWKERAASQNDASEDSKDPLALPNATSSLVTLLSAKSGTLHAIYRSPAFKTVLGHDPATLIGDLRSLPMLFTEEAVEDLARFDTGFLEGTLETPLRFKATLRHGDGQTLTFCEHEADWLPLSSERLVIIYHRVLPLGPSCVSKKSSSDGGTSLLRVLDELPPLSEDGRCEDDMTGNNEFSAAELGGWLATSGADALSPPLTGLVTVAAGLVDDRNATHAVPPVQLPLGAGPSPRAAPALAPVLTAPSAVPSELPSRAAEPAPAPAAQGVGTSTVSPAAPEAVSSIAPIQAPANTAPPQPPPNTASPETTGSALVAPSWPRPPLPPSEPRSPSRELLQPPSQEEAACASPQPALQTPHEATSDVPADCASDVQQPPLLAEPEPPLPQPPLPPDAHSPSGGAEMDAHARQTRSARRRRQRAMCARKMDHAYMVAGHVLVPGSPDGHSMSCGCHVDQSVAQPQQMAGHPHAVHRHYEQHHDVQQHQSVMFSPGLVHHQQLAQQQHMHMQQYFTTHGSSARHGQGPHPMGAANHFYANV